MGRAIRNWTPERVEDFEVAPHRYTFNDFDDSFRFKFDRDWMNFKAALPYKVGDVVYVVRHGEAKRAKIYAIFPRRNHHGDLMEVYRVQVETKKGLFSKSTEDTHPGFIQRGYQLAGLAPDLDAADAQERAFNAQLRRSRMKAVQQ